MKKLVNILLIISAILVIASSCTSTKKNTKTVSRGKIVTKTKPLNKNVAVSTKKHNTKIPSNKVQPNKGGNKLTNKYADKMSARASELNPELYSFIDNWMGTPYKMGGTTKKGVDCSGFVGEVYKHFGKTLPRTTGALAKAVTVKGAKNLKEGDLVFFSYARTNSHVGIYLQNGWFVHASTSRGVVLSDLNEAHYKKRFNMGGTPKVGGL